ncbi:hypothetical protein BJY00DRAFT_165004 [Aspergillus carlsbadensis]|nr:hypothetical protein BJY00DRAFT_165004 [Aspergillus carlsbadensis]
MASTGGQRGFDTPTKRPTPLHTTPIHHTLVTRDKLVDSTAHFHPGIFMAPTPTGRQEPPIPTFELGQLLCLLWDHSVALTTLGALGRPRCGGADDDTLEFLGARASRCTSSPRVLANLPSFSKSLFCGDQIVDCEIHLMSLPAGNLQCFWGTGQRIRSSSLAKSRPSIPGGQTLHSLWSHR